MRQLNVVHPQQLNGFYIFNNEQLVQYYFFRSLK